MAQSIKLARRPMTAISTASTVSSTVSRTAIASTLVTSNSRQTSSLHTTSRRNPRLCCQRQCSASPSPRRAYHSRHHPPFPPHYTYPDSPSANSILTAALTHVPRHGFTNEALTLGARDAGYLDVSVQLFPRGAFEIILFYLASRRELLKERAEKGEIFGGVANGAESLSVEEKVKMLVMERLRMNEEIIDQWQDALALMSLPTHVPASLSELHSLSSDILTLASDPSVDASWYTKRLSVAAIYASAEVVMTQDSSPNFAATEAFVQRRLEDSKGLGEKAADIKGFLGYMATSAVGLGRSWGLKI